jgi:hypothetical protein
MNKKCEFLPVNSPGVQQIIKSEMNKREVRIAEKTSSIKTVWRWLRRFDVSSSEQPSHGKRKCVSSVIRWTTSVIIIVWISVKMNLDKIIEEYNNDKREEVRKTRFL